MAEKDLNYVAVHMQIAGTKVMPDVLQMLRSSGLSDTCYAYKIRTKPEAKLIQKVALKKEEGKLAYELANITDVVGLRLVALFRTDMAELFEEILLAIKHNNGINPNPFLRGKPEEIIIYKGANAFDDLLPRLRDIASKQCPDVLIKEVPSREGYSSVHLVTRLDSAPEITHTSGYKLPSNYKLPIEIQIRSVFEDAWGEIDHKYGYVIRTGKDIGKPINNPEFVLEHLKVLKRFSDACMEYADVIRAEAVGVPQTLMTPRKVVSVLSDNMIIDRFKSLNIDEDVIAKYCEARDVKDQAGELIDQNLAEAKQRYLNAAEMFRELISSVDVDASLGEKLVYYYLKMNEALCLLSTNERDQVIAAHGIYQSLEGVYPEYPLLKMRYGQALGKLGHIDLAIENLRESGEATKEVAANFINHEPASWPDNLPFTDYDHIVHTQPKLLGYHIWLKIRTLGMQDEEQKLALFQEAYKVTRMGLDSVDHTQKQELSLHNNLLYYALGVLTRIGLVTGSGNINKDVFVKSVNEHANFIESAAPEIFQASTLDTMMKAYSILGQPQKAIKYANMLLDSCLNPASLDFDSNEKLKMVGAAHQVIKGNALVMIDILTQKILQRKFDHIRRQTCLYSFQMVTASYSCFNTWGR